MKIGELLELTQTKRVSEIARESLDFGEKKAVEALKAAGCYSVSGKRGWYFDGDESVLEKSIYDFVPASKRKGIAKATANVSTNEHNHEKTKQPKKVSANVVKNEMNESVQRSNVPAKEEIKQANEQVAPTKERTKETSNVVRKRSSFDLDVDLLKELKIQAVMHDKNVYEMVETAIRQYLMELRK